MDIDKIDIEILYVMLVNNAITPMSSFSIKKLLENFELSLSYHTILRRINTKLIPNGYLAEGLKNGNSKSFYLTEFAIKFMKENVFEKENPYEIIEEIVNEFENENVQTNINKMEGNINNG